MFSKSCNLVFFCIFYLGRDFTDFFGYFFLRIMSKAQVFQMFFMGVHQNFQTWEVWVWSCLLSYNFKVSVLELFESRSLWSPLMRSLTTRTFKFLQMRLRRNQSPILSNQAGEASRMAVTSPLKTDFPPYKKD